MKAKNRRTPILIAVATIAACVGLYFVIEHFRFVETDNAQIDGHAVLLAARVGGFITKVNVHEGQKVKKDEVLIELDERDYGAQLAQAKANLVSLEARKQEAERNFQRLSDLYRQGAVSQQQLDAATSNFSEAKARFDGLQAQVTVSEINYENTKIKSPFDAVIARKSAEVGQLASPGVPLIGVVSSQERWVTANFKETQIENIKIGAKAYISVDAVSHRDFTGEVESISSATGGTFALLPPDNATGNFTKVVQRVPVRIKLPNLDAEQIDELRAGLSVFVKVLR